MTFGKRLAKLRTARGLLGTELSKMIGNGGGTIVYDWEGKERCKNPRFESVIKLSEALHVPLSAFAYDEACERCVEMIEEGML